MRPRIHHAFMVEVRMLDAIATRAATEQSADAPEVLSGYDDDFKEIVVVSNPTRMLERKEQTSIFIPSQIESPTFEALVQMSAGNIPDSKLTIVWARKDLEWMKLIVPETGLPVIRVNDRVLSFYDRAGELVTRTFNPPGLFVSEVRPTWGIANQGDLFLVTLDTREQGVHQ